MKGRDQVLLEEAYQSILEQVGGNYLYHGTNKDAAKNILSGGFFKANTLGQQYATKRQTKLPTVSFTRQLRYLINPDQEGVGSGDYEVIFVIDRNKLESNYKTMGTSQTPDTTSKEGKRALDRFNSYDVNRDGKVDFKDADQIFKDGTMKEFGKPASREEVGRRVGEYVTYNKGAMYYTKSGKHLNLVKSGGEFEEVVPVEATGKNQWGTTGVLPWKRFLYGFYIKPESDAAKDEELLNHLLRLKMSRPNVFVKAN